MSRFYSLSKTVLVAWVGLSGACIGRAPVSVGPATGGADAPRYASRLVLALDGIDYRDIQDARDRGLFAEFRAPSRLISTFPSISDIAWHEIFDVLPPRGYQRIYFSGAYNSMIGGPMDAIRPIEFEDRMDMAFGGKLHHLSAYIASNKVARREVTTVTREFFETHGRTTVYAYNVGPDAMQHTRGDLESYLRHLDSQLLALQREYHKRTGHSLEIVVLSDHGHNHFADAQFLPIAKALRAFGFRPNSQLENANDVAFSVDGVTTGFGVFAVADSVASVAHAIAGMEGVELVSFHAGAGEFKILSASDSALVQHRVVNGNDVYRYQSVGQDPLHYTDVVARMHADSVLDHEGFADATVWLRYTASHKYPAALERIVRGHTQVTLNPAPILVSIETGRQVGLGMVSVANKLRPLGGTHGALNADNSLGVVMANFMNTHDDVTSRVREQFGGFADFGDIKGAPAGARITTSSLLARDRRARTYRQSPPVNSDTDELFFEIWITDAQRQWAREGGGFYINVKRVGVAGNDNESISMHYLPMPTAERDDVPGITQTADGNNRFLVALSQVFTAPLLPSTRYSVQISLDRTPTRVTSAAQSATSLTKAITVLDVRTNAAGRIWPY